MQHPLPVFGREDYLVFPVLRATAHTISCQSSCSRSFYSFQRSNTFDSSAPYVQHRDLSECWAAQFSALLDESRRKDWEPLVAVTVD